MVSAKRLAKLAKKWQTMAAMGRKRLTQTTAAKRADEEHNAMTSVAVKGHSVMYTTDEGSVQGATAYLSTVIFSELLRMYKEESGFAGGNDDRITLPCDAMAMENGMCLLT